MHGSAATATAAVGTLQLRGTDAQCGGGEGSLQAMYATGRVGPLLSSQEPLLSSQEIIRHTWQAVRGEWPRLPGLKVVAASVWRRLAPNQRQLAPTLSCRSSSARPSSRDETLALLAKRLVSSQTPCRLPRRVPKTPLIGGFHAGFLPPRVPMNAPVPGRT